MPDDRRFSAVFIGSRSLLLQCVERYLEDGHELRAIVSADPAVRRWADQHRLLVIEPGPDLASRLKDIPFDYLFSVVHLSIIPASVLALPRLGAINFHDGPLPGYAGLNVTSWAILNQERSHGICWHMMEEAVDRGDVLEHVQLPIDDDDTALTVNAKCYEAGLKSFGKLLHGLKSGAVQRQPQDLTRSNYYGKHKRPANAAIIDWAQSADAIAALVRALDFGPYANPLAEAKVWLNGVPIIVKEVVVLPVPSEMPPGTITCIADDAITVATADLDIHLRRFFSMMGRPIEIREVLAARGLAEQAVLKPLDAEFAEAVSRTHAELCKHESFWTHRLREFEPIEVPFAQRGAEEERDARFGRAVLRMPHERYSPSNPGVSLLAALALYFGRIGRKEEFDILFQNTSARSGVNGLGELFAVRVPMRVVISKGQKFSEFRASVGDELERLHKYGAYALDLVSREPDLKKAAGQWHDEAATIVIQRQSSLKHSTHAPKADLTIVIADNDAESHWHYRTSVYDEATIARMQRQFASLLTEAGSGDRSVGDLCILSEHESRECLIAHNRTERSYAHDLCVHELLEAQAQRTPNNAAVVFRDTVTTYAELDARANRIAHYLLESCHAAPGGLIGVLMNRSDDMLAGMIGVLKAGCAYVPLDPDYPADRLAYMANDAGLATIVSQACYAAYLPGVQANMVALDQIAIQLASQPATKPVVAVRPSDLAYVIYTSGSTGKPKGVMVEHGNVVNFFAGMDDRLGHDEPGTWLAVTSTSFDISVLELFWTLARGFKVVLYGGDDRAAFAASNGKAPAVKDVGKSLDFSLFYFASDENEKGRMKYGLLLEGARYADANDFAAVWTPERHFHAFGGLYPNPSVASAAIAAITNRVQIRAGSCVLPLHNPIRIAEEWALVDNLSNGRVGISFASGWQPNDFVLAPEAFEERARHFYEGIKTVRTLWRGEKLSFDGPKGKVEIQTLPRPVQPELPFWITAAGNPETFRRAGELGANLLTHLLGQSVEELAKKLEAYRDAWRQAGHPGDPYVTLMLHTFVSEDEGYVRAQVEQPLKNYLRSATDLVKNYASAFPAFRQGKRGEATDMDKMFRSLSADDLDTLLTHAFHRYYETSGLFGTPQSCLAMVDRLKKLGVDEIACLIDFGCPSDVVLTNLPWLNELRKLAAPSRKASAQTEVTIPALMERHQITHLQCTPSLAAMLTKNKHARERLRHLKNMMVGGEAFPTELAAELRGLVAGCLLNMYGPTETTIWSTTHELQGPIPGSVPLGTPIANTQIYIVDEELQALPAGIPGELVIGGHGVVRGYLNRDDLTAERFVANRFPGGSGRLYRTGDLARWRADGTLEFLGRIDNQVKIRGHRIELGEIETILCQHPAVHQGVVVAREDGKGDKRLVGYVVARPGVSPSVTDLREFLQRGLPEFMVPGSIVMLDELPLTPNKKIDRRALPAPDQSRPDLSEIFVAPRTNIERKVSVFWSSALALERIGVNDKFSDLGGDSLLAVEIIVKISSEFDVEFPLHAFFQAPTIAGLAAKLECLVTK